MTPIGRDIPHPTGAAVLSRRLLDMGSQTDHPSWTVRHIRYTSKWFDFPRVSKRSITFETKLTELWSFHSCTLSRYVLSNILLAARRPLCSTFLLRLTNLSYTFMILFTVASLLKLIHPHITRQEQLHSAAVIICFPILWFFNFLYYTDGGSSAFVLLSWLAAKKRHHLLSALVRV